MSKKTDFSLSQTERKYLRTGETGSYSEKELQRRIAEKRDNIDSRLEDFINDIMLMFSNGYLSIDEDIDSFCEVFNLEIDLEAAVPMTTTKRETGAHPESPGEAIHHPQAKKSKLEKTEEIGYMFGIFLHLLMTMAPKERPWDEMFKGILMFFVMNPYKRSDEQIKRLEELIDFGMKKPATEIRSMSDTEGEYVYHFSRDENIYNPTSEIRNILAENNIPISNVLVHHIASKIDSIDDFYRIERITNKNLETLKEETQLEKTINLYRIINKDKSYLSQEWRGPSRIKIIKARFNPEIDNYSKNIASEITNSTQGNLVSTALNKMSDRVNDEELWTAYPIFEDVDGSLEFTPYGQLFALYLNENISLYNLHIFGISNKTGYENDISDKKLISDVFRQFSGDEE